jgi:hypothetical protein
MGRKLWINLGLLAVIGIFALLAAFEPGKKKEVPIPLAQIDTGAVRKIEISGKETLSLEKKEGHWFLVSPFQAPANDHRVDLLLKIPETASSASYPAVASELARFGLAPPGTVLRLDELSLEFGDSDPIQQHRYVKVGDTLQLVEDNFHHHLTAPATDYVEKKLLPENPDLRKIELPGLTLNREEGGKWRSEPPQDPPGPLYELADAWRYARAFDVKRHEAKDAPPGETIRVSLGQDKPLEFGIVRRAPELVLLRADWGLEFHLTEETSKSLLTLKAPEPAPPSAEAAPATR